MNVECGKEKHLKCLYCESSYYYKQDLEKHLRRIHKYIL
ncbi:hypothetical protein BDFB_007395 [Asbolus verrucosus]|uniref:C2H2-type domain-containing protein n=1 Tax=Asbolus verrucosus TaxID=1661398 RepID=A0A482VNQ5_ASBVE|nr:hypothetical protein BDFB_007395 [Asbolus verrucosus]